MYILCGGVVLAAQDSTEYRNPASMMRWPNADASYANVRLCKDASINSQAASIFKKVWENIRVMAVILGPCHPDNLKAAFPIYLIFKILYSSINS